MSGRYDDENTGSERYRTPAEDEVPSDGEMPVRRQRRAQRNRSAQEQDAFQDTYVPQSREPMVTQRQYGSSRNDASARAYDETDDPYDADPPRRDPYAAGRRETPARDLRPARAARDAYDAQEGQEARGRSAMEDTDPYAAPGRSGDPYAKRPRAPERPRGMYGEEGTPRPAAAKPKRFDDEADDMLYDEDDPDYEDNEPGGKRHVVRWVIIIGIIVVLLAGITYVGTQRPDLVEKLVGSVQELIAGPTASPAPTEEPTQAPTATPEPAPSVDQAAVVTFSASPEEEPDINQPIEFRVVTTLQTDRVSIVDSNGQVLIERVNSDYADTSEGRTWTLRYYFLSPYEGNVEAHPGNEAGWNEASGAVTMISVGMTQQSGGPLAVGGSADGSQQDGGVASTLSGDAPVPVTVSSTIITPTETVETYSRETPIHMGGADAYWTKGSNSASPSISTFRGGNLRQNSALGTVALTEKKLSAAWTSDAGTVLSGGASMWNVQPAIIHWNGEIRRLMPLAEEKADKANLKEVIFGSGDGNLYFFDLDDGQATREPMATNSAKPILSSASVHPLGFPLLFVGVGDLQQLTAEDKTTGMLVYDMINYGQRGMLTSWNEQALSREAAFLGSALVDSNSDVLITVGSNGLLYTMGMETELDRSVAGEEKVLVRPTMAMYKSSVASEDTSVYAAHAAYGENVYFATRGGVLQCVNVNTLTPEWALSLGAEVRASLALEAEGTGDVYLYAATVAGASGQSMAHKINAQTGEVIFSVALPGSISASPVVGLNGLGEYVYFTAENTAIYALSKATGNIAWQATVTGANTPSPIALYEENGTGYIVQGMGNGMALLEGASGDQIDFLTMDAAPVGSPAAFDNMLVVATSDGTLCGISIR